MTPNFEKLWGKASAALNQKKPEINTPGDLAEARLPGITQFFQELQQLTDNRLQFQITLDPYEDGYPLKDRKVIIETNMPGKDGKAPVELRLQGNKRYELLDSRWVDHHFSAENVKIALIQSAISTGFLHSKSADADSSVNRFLAAAMDTKAPIAPKTASCRKSMRFRFF